MCNPYNITTSQDAIREWTRALRDVLGNLEPSVDTIGVEVRARIDLISDHHRPFLLPYMAPPERLAAERFPHREPSAAVLPSVGQLSP